MKSQNVSQIEGFILILLSAFLIMSFTGIDKAHAESIQPLPEHSEI
ncbi:MAG TPA: hypothetical protein VIG33_09550 [Pseudobdellovibrionaceae bacterium]|jgi:hypothetical protein